MKANRTVFGLFAVLLTAATFSIAVAQDQRQPSLNLTTPSAARNVPTLVSTTARNPFTSPQPSEDRKLQSQTQSIVNQLRKANAAKTDEDKQAAQTVIETAEEQLRDVLGKRFDLLISKREKQIENLQEQIAALEAEIKKRRNAKQEIVDLRVKTLMNEANGLGFPDSGSGSAFPGRTNNYNSFFDSARSLSRPARTSRSSTTTTRSIVQPEQIAPN